MEEEASELNPTHEAGFDWVDLNGYGDQVEVLWTPDRLKIPFLENDCKIQVAFFLSFLR